MLREGKTLKLNLKVGELKDEAAPAAAEKAKLELGMSVQEITPEIARQLRLGDLQGVVVGQVEAGSAADEAGIQRGDVIREINGQAIRKSERLSERSGEAQKGRDRPPLVRRGERNLYLTLRAAKPQ